MHTLPHSRDSLGQHGTPLQESRNEVGPFARRGRHTHRHTSSSALTQSPSLTSLASLFRCGCCRGMIPGRVVVAGFCLQVPRIGWADCQNTITHNSSIGRHRLLGRSKQRRGRFSLAVAQTTAKHREKREWGEREEQRNNLNSSADDQKNINRDVQRNTTRKYVEIITSLETLSISRGIKKKEKNFSQQYAFT